MFNFITEQFLAGALVGLGCGYMIGGWLYGHLIDSAIEGRAAMRRRDAASYSEPVKPASKRRLLYSPAAPVEKTRGRPPKAVSNPQTPLDFGFEGKTARLREDAKLPKDIPLPLSPCKADEELDASLNQLLTPKRSGGFDAAAPSAYQDALERRQVSEHIPAEYLKWRPWPDVVNEKEGEQGYQGDDEHTPKSK